MNVCMVTVLFISFGPIYKKFITIFFLLFKYIFIYIFICWKIKIIKYLYHHFPAVYTIYDFRFYSKKHFISKKKKCEFKLKTTNWFCYIYTSY